MYGYDVPQYTREYLNEWRREDRFLRLRWSLDEPGMFILERKTRYLTDHPFRYGTDKQVQYKDGYRMVFRFRPSEIKYVRQALAETDIQRLGGAVHLAAIMRQQEDIERERLEREQRAYMEALSGEFYDHLAWAEGRRTTVA